MTPDLFLSYLIMMYGIAGNGEKIKATPDQRRSTCQCCGHELIAKCGEINIWHWAHESNSINCDSKKESEWHLFMKECFPKERTEVRIEKNGIVKIADAITIDGLVVEFQNSSISVEEIQFREFFYKDMMWVFNCHGMRERFNFYKKVSKYGNEYYNFRWKHAWKSISFCKKPVYLDLYDDCFRVKKMKSKSPVTGWGYLKEIDVLFKFLERK